jgi:hypothetical protein
MMDKELDVLLPDTYLFQLVNYAKITSCQQLLFLVHQMRFPHKVMKTRTGKFASGYLVAEAHTLFPGDMALAKDF